MKSLPQIAANAKQYRQPKPRQADAPEKPSDLAEGLAGPMKWKWERAIRSGQPELRTSTRAKTAWRASEDWPKQKVVGETMKRQGATKANTESSLTPNTRN